MALVLYLLESLTIETEHDLIIQESDGVNIQERLDAIGNNLSDFVKAQLVAVRELLSGQYEAVERAGTIEPINATRYVVGDLVDAVIDAARRISLKMTVSYCTKITENHHYIATTFFFGCYPRMLEEKEKPTEEHYCSPRKSRCAVKPALSTIAKDSVKGTVVQIPNPFFLKIIFSYCRTE
jgi:hypothetical protein